VIEYSEDIEVLPIKQVFEKKIQVLNTIQLPVIGHSIKKGYKTNEAAEIIIHFNKWVMPPQPQAYIKCPRYDFF
jgi:protein involved in polysaccharide export with SLBB domain